MTLRPSGLSSLPAPELDLAATLLCGQVFHWRPIGAGFAGVIDRTPVYLEQEGERLWVTTGCEELATRYLALDHPLAEIYASFPVDPTMRAALAACRGLRIVRQPVWECLGTFITSALKQVGHIAQISHTLREKYGASVGQIGGLSLSRYPEPARIAALAESDLRACGLGFRARSLLETARAVATADGAGRLERLPRLPRAEALAALTAFRGVGAKVANCVSLFACGHLDAFPVDVWIARVLRDRYFGGDAMIAPGRLQEFADGYFGPYGGYAQQYLFHQARATRRPRAGRKVAPVAGRPR